MQRNARRRVEFRFRSGTGKQVEKTPKEDKIHSTEKPFLCTREWTHRHPFLLPQTCVINCNAKYRPLMEPHTSCRGVSKPTISPLSCCSPVVNNWEISSRHYKDNRHFTEVLAVLKIHDTEGCHSAHPISLG